MFVRKERKSQLLCDFTFLYGQSRSLWGVRKDGDSGAAGDCGGLSGEELSGVFVHLFLFVVAVGSPTEPREPSVTDTTAF